MTNPVQVQVTFDCAEPRRVAEFWKAVLGYADPPAYEDDDAWAVCQDPDGVRPRLYFQRVPEGKTAKNRVHLDVKVGAGLVGAEWLEVLEQEGNELCLD